jgi:hypothetical protein
MRLAPVVHEACGRTSHVLGQRRLLRADVGLARPHAARNAREAFARATTTRSGSHDPPLQLLLVAVAARRPSRTR